MNRRTDGTSNRYTRVLIYPLGDGFQVVGYQRGTFYPEGRFDTLGTAAEHALTLPVKDERAPINFLRGGLFE